MPGDRLIVMQQNFIPALDPNPLPAPYWVFKLLLLTTFFLHIVAMNLVVGGGVLALIAKWGVADRKLANRLFADVAGKLPCLLPATITLGVAPLLFVQVLYGQFFYTSSIIMAWPWLAVLLMLAIAYYGLYFSSSLKQRQPGRARSVLSVSMVLLAVIAFLYCNNLTLSQTPLRWSAKYFANPRGWNLNLTEPSLLPRFLHFFTAAVALGGLFLTLLAWLKRKSDEEYARCVFQFGGRAFMFATMAQVVVGFWFLASLPREMVMLFLGGSARATLLLVLGMAGAIAGIFVMSESVRREDARVGALWGSGITAFVVLAMVVMRDMLRDAYLKPYFQTAQFSVRTQWSALLLFAVLLIFALVLWFAMFKRYGLLNKENVTVVPHMELSSRTK
jgi:hypothetical protein